MRAWAPRDRLKEIWRDRHHRSATLLIMALGCGALLMSGWSTWRTSLLLRHAAVATGTVVDPRQHQQVRFTTAAGAAVTFVQNGHLSRPEGASVPVVYDPGDPGGTAQAGTFEALWGDPIGFLISGLVAILAPLLGFNASWNWQRR